MTKYGHKALAHPGRALAADRVSSTDLSGLRKNKNTILTHRTHIWLLLGPHRNTATRQTCREIIILKANCIERNATSLRMARTIASANPHAPETRQNLIDAASQLLTTHIPCIHNSQSMKMQMLNAQVHVFAQCPLRKQPFEAISGKGRVSEAQSQDISQ